jgi:hypothetical protein
MLAAARLAVAARREAKFVQDLDHYAIPVLVQAQEHLVHFRSDRGKRGAGLSCDRENECVETLLQSNRRAELVLVSLAAIPLGVGLLLFVLGVLRGTTWLSVAGILPAIYGLYEFVRQFLWWWQPRLALQGNELVVFLRQPRPYRVPVEFVECFFIGQAASTLRLRHPTGSRIESVTVVVRLAERAKQWRERPSNQAVGRWCDGYITIVGDWTDRLDGEVITRMNRRLVEYKKHQRQEAVSSS